MSSSATTWRGHRLDNIRLKLVVVVIDGDRILTYRDPADRIFRLPATPWPRGTNPTEVVRDLVADRACGLAISPTLRASLRLSDTAGLLLFTARPLTAPGASSAAEGFRWISVEGIRGALPPSDLPLALRALQPIGVHRPPRHRRHLAVVPAPPISVGPSPTLDCEVADQ